MRVWPRPLHWRALLHNNLEEYVQRPAEIALGHLSSGDAPLTYDLFHATQEPTLCDPLARVDHRRRLFSFKWATINPMATLTDFQGLLRVVLPQLRPTKALEIFLFLSASPWYSRFRTFLNNAEGLRIGDTRYWMDDRDGHSLTLERLAQHLQAYYLTRTPDDDWRPLTRFRSMSRGRRDEQKGTTAVRQHDDNGNISAALDGSCWNCGETGHRKSQCPSPPKMERSSSSRSTDFTKRTVA